MVVVVPAAAGRRERAHRLMRRRLMHRCLMRKYLMRTYLPPHLSPACVDDRYRAELGRGLCSALPAMDLRVRRRCGDIGNGWRVDDVCGLRAPAGPFEAPICLPHPAARVLEHYTPNSNATDPILE